MTTTKLPQEMAREKEISLELVRAANQAIKGAENAETNIDFVRAVLAQTKFEAEKRPEA